MALLMLVQRCEVFIACMLEGFVAIAGARVLALQHSVIVYLEGLILKAPWPNG